MKIREANKFDLPNIIAMLRNFQQATPVDIMQDCDNEEHVNKMYHHIILGGGIALIAEKDNKPVGIIAGVIDHNIWDPQLTLLRELVYWVEPDARGSTAGYKLLHRYTLEAKKLVKEGKIKLYTMTKMVNSPELDFGRFGYQKTEEIWAAGA